MIGAQNSHFPVDLESQTRGDGRLLLPTPMKISRKTWPGIDLEMLYT